MIRRGFPPLLICLLFVVTAARADVEEGLPARDTLLVGMVVGLDGLPATSGNVDAYHADGRFDRIPLGESGEFSLRYADTHRMRPTLIVSSAKDDSMAWVSPDFHQPGQDFLSIPLVPSCETLVHVTDQQRRGVAAAKVNTVVDGYLLRPMLTGGDGWATIKLPRDTRVDSIYAAKDEVGFQYYEVGSPFLGTQTLAASLPKQLHLQLSPSRALTVRLVDSRQQPIRGAFIRPSLLHLPSKNSVFDLAAVARTGPLGAISEATGVATIGWIPEGALDISDLVIEHPEYAFSSDPEFSDEQPSDEQRSVTVVGFRKSKLRGTALRPDGTPAPSVNVYCKARAGRGYSAAVKTDADGRFQFDVPPNESIHLAVMDGQWAAETIQLNALHPGEVLDDVRIDLVKGTIIRGVATYGKDRLPMHGSRISLLQKFGEKRLVQGSWPTTSGQYQFRVARGTYTILCDLSGPNPELVEVTGQEEIVRNKHFRRHPLDVFREINSEPSRRSR